jgi:cytochrome c-type biogenesis protein CcmE
MARKNKNKKWIIGGIVIAAAIIAISFLSLGKNAVYFYTPEEAVLQAKTLIKKDIKVGGMVQPGSQKWNPAGLNLEFILTDFEGHNINIKHKGTPPDMFKEGSGVVVEGRINAAGDAMVSRNLMVKHSEEYKKPDTGHSIDKELIKESMLKK